MTTIKGAKGEALTLQGSGLNPDVNDFTRTKVKVTLKRIKGPIKGFKISSKNKLMGVMLRFTNEGEQLYDDPLPNGTLKLAGGGTGKQAVADPARRYEPLQEPDREAQAGQVQERLHRVRDAEEGELESFEYITDAGYGDTGKWALVKLIAAALAVAAIAPAAASAQSQSVTSGPVTATLTWGDGQDARLSIVRAGVAGVRGADHRTWCATAACCRAPTTSG